MRFLLGPRWGESGQCGKRNLVNREAWLEQILAKIPAGSRILDAGAGELRYKDFCPHLEYVSQDSAQYDGQGDGVALQTGTWDRSQVDIVSDVTSIPEPDASFDAVMCIEVLEHLPDPICALRELGRLLKSGGILIVTAPFCSLTHFSPHFYQTGYAYRFYEYWLDKLRFTIEDLQYNGNYFEYLAQELRRCPSVGREYGSDSPNLIERFSLRISLGMLARFSSMDRGSDELLCYGLHVVARKR